MTSDTQTIDKMLANMTRNTQTIDKLIADLDAAMNGEAPGAVGAGEFTPNKMDELRGIVRASLGLSDAPTIDSVVQVGSTLVQFNRVVALADRMKAECESIGLGDVFDSEMAETDMDIDMDREFTVDLMRFELVRLTTTA